MTTLPRRLLERFIRDRDDTAVGLGLLFAGLVGVGLWAGAVAHAAQFVFGRVSGVPGQVVLLSGLTGLFGLVLGSLAYARFRGLTIEMGVPRRGAWPSALAVGFAPALLVLGVAVLGNAVFDVTLSAMVQRRINPDGSTPTLLVTVAPPAVFLALGYGFLFCGVVCERVRGLVGSERTVAVATALSGLFWLLPVDAVQRLRLDVGGLVEIALSLLFGVAFGMSLGILYRRGDGMSFSGLDRRELVVVAVAAIGVLGVGMELLELPRSVGDLLWVAGLAIAIVGYARTRSVWPSVLSLVVLALAISGVVYAEAVLGLAAPP